jgi:TonB family protein
VYKRQEDENAIYHIIDANKKPTFPGGERAMYDFVNENLKYPDVCQQIGAQGTAYVQFVVDKTGKIRDVVVKNKVHSLLVAEATRVVNSMSAWMPAEKQGKKINVRLTLPVQFKLSGNIFPLENDSITNETLSPDRQLVVLDGQILPYGFDNNWLNFSEIKSYELLIPKSSDEEKEFRLKFGPYSTRGVFVAVSKKYYNNIDNNGNKIYDVIEQMPQYPGGEGELLKFINSNLKYPSIAQTQKIQGTVIVRFVVNSFGNTEKVEVLRGLSPECDEEAMRVIKLLKNWIPGKQNGEALSVHYTLPIRFALM